VPGKASYPSYSPYLLSDAASHFRFFPSALGAEISYQMLKKPIRKLPLQKMSVEMLCLLAVAVCTPRKETPHVCHFSE
jgi:hypothetical protein